MSTYSQVQRNGLFELSDEAKQELASSSYYNDDLAPSSVLKEHGLHTQSQCFGLVCQYVFHHFRLHQDLSQWVYHLGWQY